MIIPCFKCGMENEVRDGAQRAFCVHCGNELRLNPNVTFSFNSIYPDKYTLKIVILKVNSAYRKEIILDRANFNKVGIVLDAGLYKVCFYFASKSYSRSFRILDGGTVVTIDYVFDGRNRIYQEQKQF